MAQCRRAADFPGQAAGDDVISALNDAISCLFYSFRMIDNFQKLSGKLDAEGKKALKKGQLAWIRDRKQSCSKTEPGHFYVDLECATETAIARAQFLQNRVRECPSAGCQNSKL